MANIILGEQTYTELPIERSFDPRRGWSTTRKFKGEANSINGLALALNSHRLRGLLPGVQSR